MAAEIYQFQYQNNPVYRQYLDTIGHHPVQITRLEDIPFLPISFFKTHQVRSRQQAPEIIFSSSGTTGSSTSRHYVCQASWYEKAFHACFRFAYGDSSNFAWECLLPAYLERKGSSLVYMADVFVKESRWRQSGFFLQAGDALRESLNQLREQKAPTILLGVTFALLDFADANKALDLSWLTIMETGGMKGRRQEMVRWEVHERLQKAFGVKTIHSEYGMTEMMSQAYSKGNGIYQPPPWMRVLVRSEEDPFAVRQEGAGIICIIDLANIDSCCFLETQDVGRVLEDGSFEILGRMDNSDIRGCSLLVV